MPSAKRFWIIAYPDLDRPIGGIKQLHRLCEILNTSGFQCFLIQDSADFKPNWFSSNVNTISRSDFFNTIQLRPDFDCIVLPETYIAVIINIVDESIPRIIYNQNSSYTFGIDESKIFKPEKIAQLYKLPSVKQIWCVSHFDRNFLINAFHLSPSKVFCISNSLDIPSPSLHF